MRYMIVHHQQDAITGDWTYVKTLFASTQAGAMKYVNAQARGVNTYPRTERLGEVLEMRFDNEMFIVSEIERGMIVS